MVFAQVDPALTLAVGAAAQAETGVLNSIKKHQEEIAIFQGVILSNLAVVKEYEENMYSYLSNVSGAVKNAVELKQAADLTSEIINSFGSCASAASKHPQGLIVVSIVNKQTKKATEEMVGIYSYLSTLVLNKDNLLNSAERNQIMWTVLAKLRKIKSDIMLLQFQIEQHTLADIPIILFPMEYYYAVDGKNIADNIIQNFSRR